MKSLVAEERYPLSAHPPLSETYLQAAAVGLVGATLEDAAPGSRKDKPLFDIGEATERVAAAVEASNGRCRRRRRRLR